MLIRWTDNVSQPKVYFELVVLDVLLLFGFNKVVCFSPFSNMSEIRLAISEKGKPMVVSDDYKYRLHKKRWVSTMKSCKAFLKTEEEVAVEIQGDHNHAPLGRSLLTRNLLSNSLKRKAVDDISEPQ